MNTITIGNKKIGTNCPTFIVAEMSANHNQDFERAVKIIKVAKEAGADAIKLQTYTPDSITIDSENEYFKIKGTFWDGKTLYDLYKDACTPWDWHKKLQDICKDIGLIFFSTPFDFTSVDFLEKLNVPAYKIASSELIDHQLLKKVADTEKPIILSTGMADIGEIDEAIKVFKRSGNNKFVLLRCVATYPSRPEEMNLSTIPNMIETFNSLVGLSDHSLGIEIPLVAITLGVCIVEKHLTLSRNEKDVDSHFSLEPDEFRDMVNAIRIAEKAIGSISYGACGREKVSRLYRRSLFVVEDISQGEEFSNINIRSIRPGQGIEPKYQKDIIGCKARIDIKKGTPLYWNMIE